MKNKLIKGLAGIILIGGLALNSFGQKKGDYIPNTLHGVKYSDKTWKENNFSLEKQYVFGKYNLNDEPIILVKNKDWDNGELGFVVYRESETEVLNTYGGGISLKGRAYPPTILVNENEDVIQKFELQEINADLEKTLKKCKRKSENSFGFSIDFTNKEIKSKLPVITLPDGKEYVCFNLNWGRFIDKNNQPIYVYENKDRLSHVFIPLIKGRYIEGINLGCGNTAIYSQEGFYNPITEEAQAIKGEEVPAEEQKEKKLDGKKEDLENICIYIVKKGDTIWKIAEELYGTGKEADEIYKLNPEIDPKTNLINIGQKIKIPCE